MAYLEAVWDLVEKKEHDNAWQQANAALVEIMQLISSRGWLEDSYKKKVAVMGEEWTKATFFEDMTIEVGSILYAMSEICYRESKYNTAYTYLYASSLLNWKSLAVNHALKKASKKAQDKAICENEARQIFDKWRALGVGF